MPDILVTVRIEGSTANDGLVPAYDVAKFMDGLSRAVNITTHAFANRQEVKTHGNSARHADIFAYAPRKGCFEQRLCVRLAPQLVDAIGESVIAEHYWDYLSWCWSNAVGEPSEPARSLAKKANSEREEFIYEIADALETPMANLHRPIQSDPKMTVVLERPRVGDILQMA